MLSNEFDKLILSKMPRFIAVSYQEMLMAETPQARIRAALRVYDLGLRVVTLGLVSQYLIRDKERVSDPYLNQLLLEKLPKGGLDTWQHLLFATLKVYEGHQSLFFVPELYELYWDVSTVPHQPHLNVEAPFIRLAQIRNDLEHGKLSLDESGWQSLSAETSGLLQKVLRQLIFFQNYELIRVVGYKGKTYTYECYVGLEITQYQWVGEVDVPLRLGQFYLRKDGPGFLLLHPLLVFWVESVPSQSLATIGNSGMAIFERAYHSSLQYFLPVLEKKIEESETFDAFVRLVFRTIDEVKRTRREAEKLTWLQLTEIAEEISQNRMATVSSKYKSHLYLQRGDVKIAFDSFLLSEKPGFILLGKSGVGKSNFLLATNDEIRRRHHETCLLMYDAANLNPDVSLSDTITQDFNNRLRLANREIKHIWREISEIDGIERRTILLCIDAINENRQGQVLLWQINELLQGGWPWLKVMVTSRPEAWRNIRYGVKLAEKLFYREPKTEQLAVEMEGFTYSQKLEPFSQDELPQVYEKYRQAYQVQTPFESLPETVKQSLRDPLVLWLITRTHQQQAIPDTVEITRAIPDYIAAMQKTKRLGIEDLKFLKDTLMPLMLREGHYTNVITAQDIDQAGQKVFEKINTESKLSDGQQVNQSFVNLMDAEILVRRGISLDYEIAFKYERFYDYFGGRRLASLSQAQTEIVSFYQDLLIEMQQSPFLWGVLHNALVAELNTGSDNLFIQLAQIDFATGVKQLLIGVMVEYATYQKKKAVNILATLIQLGKDGKSWIGRFVSRPGKQSIPLSILNARKLALEVAWNIGAKEILITAACDQNEDTRVAAARATYHLWRSDPKAAFYVIMQVARQIQQPLIRLPRLSYVEFCLTTTILILVDDSINLTGPELVEPLHQIWRLIIEQLLMVSEKEFGRRALRTWLREIITSKFINFTLRFAGQESDDRIKKQPSAIPELKAFFDLSDEYKSKVRPLLNYLRPNSGSLMEVKSTLLWMAEFNDAISIFLLMLILIVHSVQEPKQVLQIIHEIFMQVLPSHQQKGLIASQVVFTIMLISSLNPQIFDDEDYELIRSIHAQYIWKMHAEYSTITGAVREAAYYGQVLEKSLGKGSPPVLTSYIEKSLEIGDLALIRKLLWECSVPASYHRNINFVLDATSSLARQDNADIREWYVRALARIKLYHPEVVDSFLITAEDIPEELRQDIRATEVKENIWHDFLIPRQNLLVGRAVFIQPLNELIYWVVDQAFTQKTFDAWTKLVLKRIVNLVYGASIFELDTSQK